MKEYLNQYFEDLELKLIFKDVVGTDDPAHIQELINTIVYEQFKRNITKLLFIESSIGVVFGLLLDNGKQVILKVYSKRIDKDYLEKMNKIQEVFLGENFPAPKVLSPIISFNGTHTGFYDFIEGESKDAHEKEIRDELAKYLAFFTNVVEKHHLSPMKNFLQQSDSKRLWPLPHNKLFNFEKTSKGAAWIAKKAIEAKRILKSATQHKVLVHTDWRTENASFQGNKLIAIFDWDSLGSMSELEIVGRAAAQFTTNFRLGIKVTPSPDEARAFIKTYEQYRNKKFTHDDLKIISASSDYLIAHISRLEHALNAKEDGAYRILLKACGDNSFLFST